MNKEDKKAFRKVADEFLLTIQEEVNSCLFLQDTERLSRLVNQVHIILDHELLQALRDKGFSKEIRELADKAGEVAEPTSVQKDKEVKANE